MKKASIKRLSYLEHFLLSYTVDDMMPLYSLYRLAKQCVKEATLDSILGVLVKLSEIGFINVEFADEWGDWTHVRKITLEDLKKHCVERSEEELWEHPEQGGEFYFKATGRGKLEEAKDIYNIYYPEE